MTISKNIGFLAIISLVTSLPYTAFSQRVAPLPYSNFALNYVRTWEAKAPQTDPNTILVTASTDSFLMTTQYLDGLGRPMQTVAKGITPQGKDLVTAVTYDELGREQFKYLPFAANSFGGNTHVSDGLFKVNPFQQDSVFSKAQYPGESYYYSQVFYEASPLSRPLETFAPGDSWAGSSSQLLATNRRSVKAEYQVNTGADSVRIWTLGSTVSSLPTTSSAPQHTYAAGQLYKNVTKDEAGNAVVEYKDKEGRVILKKVQLAASPAGAHAGWLCTYYIYDDLGQLRFVLQPRAVELINATWTLTTGIRDELCFYYGYDQRGRMTTKKVPGAGEVYMVYDARDRLVMTQDANMRTSTARWLVTVYDELNRPIKTGLLTNASTASSHQAAAAGSTAYPSVASGFELLTETGYDHYNSLPSGCPSATLEATHITSTNFFTTYNAAPDYAQPITKSDLTKGLVTWTKIKVLGTTADYLYTLTLYDEKGRAIQVKSTNISGGTDVATTQYDFSGKVLRSHIKHQKSGPQANTYQLLAKHTYDHAGRLKKVYKRVNNQSTSNTTDKLIIDNSYDELGQLKTKKLGTNPQNTSQALEEVAYDYNIRGWLLGANRDYLNNSVQRKFGFELAYDRLTSRVDNNVAVTYTKAQYNGNIAGTIWRSAGDDEKRKYDFDYDAVNRLLKATFTQNESAGVWGINAGLDFSMGGDPAAGGVMKYDANGNILQMWQKGWKVGGSDWIDKLHYKYKYGNESNKLENVTDGINDAATKLGDFRTSSLYAGVKTSSSVDYLYDDNGNLVKDRNKDLETYLGADGIEYNHLNLPKKVTVKKDGSQDKGTIEYVYDAAGTKLKKITTEGSKATTTLYMMGNYVNDTLQFLAHEEGRIRPTTSPTVPFVYDYMLKDHLGNVRMVLTEEEKQDAYPPASLEASSLLAEGNYYGGLNIGRVNKNTVPGGYPNDPYTSPNDYIQKLNGSGSKTGVNMVLKVMAGDRFNMFASSYWNSGSTPTAPVSPLNELITALSNSIAPLSGGKATISELSGSVISPQATNFLASQNTYNTGRPKAFVNWVLFDEQFKYVSAGSGFQQVGGSGVLTTHTLSRQPITRNGYLYVYVSNETPNIDVFFDNLQVTHIRGSILEETHYYPFGLTMAGISSKAAGGKENRLKYNGIEKEDDLEVNIYDAHFRELDVQTGRWWQIDPVTEGYENLSPYASMYNNPMQYSDFLGNEGEACCLGLAVSLIKFNNFYQKRSLAGPTGDQMAEATGLVFSSTAGTLNGTLHYASGGIYPLNPGQSYFGYDGMNEAQSETYYGAATTVPPYVPTPLPIQGPINPASSGMLQLAPVSQNFKLATTFSKNVNLALSKALSTGLGNPFKNKTPSEVNDAMQKQVENGKLVEKYTDPVSGSKAYQNTKSKYSYNVDTGKSGKTGEKVEPAHVDVNYPNPKPNNVPPKKKLPIQEED